MRTILRFVFFVILAFNAVSSLAKSELKRAKETTAENRMSSLEVNRISARLHEIRNMDMSKLSSEEKRDLRKEVNNMKQEMQKSRPGYYIYLSLGAIIIIILLLLLL